MRDPDVGLTAAGTITTGAARDRVPATFEPALVRASSSVAAADPSGSLYLYGSVATGQAVVGRSDVDLVTIDIAVEDAAAISAQLSVEFDGLCRAVEIADAQQAATRDASGHNYRPASRSSRSAAFTA